MEFHKDQYEDLFIIYILPPGNIIRKHDINFNSYSVDTQLYLSFKPNETN